MAVEPSAVRLVGRAAELAVLEAELRRALTSEVRVVLVRGDPGIGKTRLVLEFLARHRRSTVTLTARASPFGASAAFELWIEALEGHLRGLDPDAMLALCRGRAETLSLLLPSAAALAAFHSVVPAAWGANF